MNATEIKEKVEEIVAKLTKSKTALNKFKKNPEETVRGFIKTDVSNDIIKKIVEAVKAKLNLDDASGVISTITGLFKK
ncbi:MAG: hypothetical protein J6V48_03820 [Clostridia bacterium]|nr:hypothetical protein [Clostridia bacterium]